MLFRSPVCNDALECVECTADDADYCTEQALLCDVESSTCVACLGDSNCSTAGAARCDANECKPCNDGGQCTNIDGLPSDGNACDNGVCVDCTPDTEASTCPNNRSCNPATRQCTNTEVGSLETCQECVADSECGEGGNRCVPMTYDGQRYPSNEIGFCLKSIDLGGSCANPYRIVITRTSLSGAAADDYCGINENLATCPAVRALLDDLACDPVNQDQDCPQPAGLCRELPGMLNRCTYLCDVAQQCLPIGNPDNPNPGSSCNDYCGG